MEVSSCLRWTRRPENIRGSGFPLPRVVSFLHATNQGVAGTSSGSVLASFRSSRASLKPCAKCCRSRDLGAPFPAIWDQLHAAHGPREAARLFAKVLGQLETHGAAVV